jgi:hypothetical protein
VACQVEEQERVGSKMRVHSLAKGLSFRLAVLPLIGALLLGASASAAILTFQANLDGLQEVPPNAGPGFGQAVLTLDTVSGLVTITSGTYQDLLGGATAVTLNDAAPGFNGPISFILTLDTPGAATGTFSGGGIVTNPVTVVADMIATNTYINIRSQVFPGGEIRGQLYVVPEPSSLLLACAGIFGLFLMRQRRK